MSDPITSALINLGLNIASNAIWDTIKSTLGQPKQESITALSNFLRMQGVRISAETVIDAFVRDGVLKIEGTSLIAAQEITFGAGPGGTFSFGNNSSSVTSTTQINAGAGAYIVGNNAQVRQNADGSISFHVGDPAKKRS